ncbi:MAG TPA: sigma-70 family RNA polymerase sigma factor [Terriglobales bacterium]|jgi:RNA polymerase sigma factor (TIGR02999 family)
MNSHDLTGLLKKWGEGEEGALNQLLPAVYDELHRMAVRYLHRERPDHTLQPTALINEAYLRLVDQNRVTWENRAQFFGIAASMMRRILVDHARGHQADKRGGSAIKLPLDEGIRGEPKQEEMELVALDAALTRLARMDPEQGRLIELRYFAGLTIEETAQVMQVSPATVKRNWTISRAWLRREISRRSY